MSKNTDTYDEQTVGARIKKERKISGLSQEKLAEACHVSRATVINWEKGTLKAAKITDLLHLCNIFECDLGYLLGEFDTKRHVDADIKAELGLSEKAISAIRSLGSVDTLNFFLESAPFISLLIDVNSYAYNKSAFLNAEKIVHAREGSSPTPAFIVYASCEKTLKVDEYDISNRFNVIFRDVAKLLMRTKSIQEYGENFVRKEIVAENAELKTIQEEL